ncbi:minor capsid protein [Corallococcus sp. bb12-1]|uniref:minor capsid protein n=1 Tax=Corallococcus sp. bb12-1 TaxID=2996784 RepID=UPI003B6354A2
MPEVDARIPDRAVALVVTGGAEPQPYIGQRPSAYIMPGCQLRIRSGREDFESGQQLADAIFSALNQVTLEPHAMMRADESTPRYLGADGADRHQWLISIRIGFLMGIARRGAGYF